MDFRFIPGVPIGLPIHLNTVPQDAEHIRHIAEVYQIPLEQPTPTRPNLPVIPDLTHLFEGGVAQTPPARPIDWEAVRKRCFYAVYEDVLRDVWERIQTIVQDLAALTLIGKNGNRRTLLTHSIRKKENHLVAQLIQQRLAIGLTEYLEANTPLHIAAKKGNQEAILLLIPHININAMNRQGHTPLQIALLNGQYRAARCLIEQQADLESHFRNYEGSTQPLSTRAWLVMNRYKGEAINDILSIIHPELFTEENNRARELDEEGAVHLVAAQHPEALRCYEEAFEIRQAFPEAHPDVAANWSMKGCCYFLLGQYAQALECHQQALRITRTVLGEHHPEMSNCLDDVGEILLAMERYSEAYDHHRQALDVRKNYYGRESDPSLLRSYIHCGRSLCCLRRFQEAWDDYLVYAEEWLEITNEVPVSEEAQTLNALGEYYIAINDDKKAEEVLREALEKTRRIDQENQTIKPVIALIHHHLGVQIEGAEEALELFQKALDIREQYFGQNHPLVVVSHCAIGKVYVDQHQFQKALLHYREALRINEQMRGNEDLSVALCCNFVGKTLFALKRYDEAKEFHSRALTILQQFFPDNHSEIATSYHHLANAYLAIGRYEWARENFGHALALRQALPDANPLKLADIYARLGETYQKLEDYGLACENYRQALVIQERQFPDHYAQFERPRLHDRMGACLQALTRDREALDHYLLALRLCGSGCKTLLQFPANWEKLERTLIDKLKHLLSQDRLYQDRALGELARSLTRAVEGLADYRFVISCCQEVWSRRLLVEPEVVNEKTLQYNMRLNLGRALYLGKHYQLALEMFTDAWDFVEDKTEQGKENKKLLSWICRTLSAIQKGSELLEVDQKLWQSFKGTIYSILDSIESAAQILATAAEQEDSWFSGLLTCYELELHFIQEEEEVSYQELADCRFKLGRTYLFRGEYGKAVKVYRAALKLANGHDKKEDAAHSLIEMAICYHKCGQYHYKALQLFARAYDFANEEDRKNCIGWLCETVDSLVKSQWHSSAWTSTVNQLTPDPNVPIFALNKAGFILYNANQFKSALSAFKYALQLLSTYQKEEKGNHAELSICLAMTYQQLEQYNQALAYFSRAIVLGCDNFGIEDPRIARWVDDVSACLKFADEERSALEVRTSILNHLRHVGGKQHPLVQKMEQR